jgi:hypothetical protein
MSSRIRRGRPSGKLVGHREKERRPTIERGKDGLQAAISLPGSVLPPVASQPIRAIPGSGLKTGLQ